MTAMGFVLSPAKPPATSTSFLRSDICLIIMYTINVFTFIIDNLGCL